MYMFAIINQCGEHQTLIIASSSFYEETLLPKAITLSMANMSGVFKHLGMHTFGFRLQYLVAHDYVIISLAFNVNHIIYYHMDAQ